MLKIMPYSSKSLFNDSLKSLNGRLVCASFSSNFNGFLDISIATSHKAKDLRFVQTEYDFDRRRELFDVTWSINIATRKYKDTTLESLRM